MHYLAFRNERLPAILEFHSGHHFQPMVSCPMPLWSCLGVIFLGALVRGSLRSSMLPVSFFSQKFLAGKGLIDLTTHSNLLVAQFSFFLEKDSTPFGFFLQMSSTNLLSFLVTSHCQIFNLCMTEATQTRVFIY